MFNHTPILGESHPTRVTKRLAQPDGSADNLDKSSSFPSFKGIDPYQSSSASLHLSPEEGIIQVGENAKVIKSISWQYLPEFTQEISTPQQVASRKSVKRRQQHRHLTASETNHNPIGARICVSGILAPVFLDSSGYPSGSPTHKQDNYPSPAPINNPTSVPIEITTKYPSHVQK